MRRRSRLGFHSRSHRPFRRSPWLVVLLAALLYWALRTPPGEGPELAYETDDWNVVARVIDGDTLDLDDGRRVRLIGIDTPEMGYSPRARVEGVPDAWAEDATAFVRAAAEGSRVRLAYGPEAKDDYGRTLAYVYLEEGTLLNAALLRRGLARAYRRIPHPLRDDFVMLEEEARAAGLGLWARDAQTR